MKRFLALWVTGVALAVAAPSGAARWLESPMLAARVAKGELPPVQERLPRVPRELRIEDEGVAPGRYGGDLRLLMGRSKDVRLMVVYGYARLVGYDRHYKLVPDILESIEVEGARKFTLRLRPGHRWSDGHPFTSEDFRYYWEDIASHDELSPFGPPPELLVDGEAPHVEVLDETAVRYTWSKPNPFFLPALAGARPEYIYAPAHYLRQFHAKYTDMATLEALAKEEGRRNWASVHVDRFHPYKNSNPDLPTLEPWTISTWPPSERFVFERNPYYHRVDGQGRQLPYVDRVIMNISDGKLIPAKTGAGEADLQARHLAFSDYTFLKQNEKRSGYDVRLWNTTRGAHIALYPNLNVEDPTWRKVVRDVRFRHALSLAIDRSEINQVIYYGLAVEGNDTVFEACPLFEKRYRTAWAEFDLERANALLDEIGLERRDAGGIRRLPDGRPLEIIVETAGEDTEQTDVLELVGATWAKVGIKLFSKPLQREVFRNRIFAGKTLVSVWSGIENGLPTPEMSPQELAPTSQHQLQWPMWGQTYETAGTVGEPVDEPEAQELLELNRQWLVAPDSEVRERIWRRMLDIRAEQTYTIGIVAGVPQPVVANVKLRNVPVKGVYNWDPGAHFGIYRPDTFWFAEN